MQAYIPRQVPPLQVKYKCGLFNISTWQRAAFCPTESTAHISITRNWIRFYHLSPHQQLPPQMFEQVVPLPLLHHLPNTCTCLHLLYCMSSFDITSYWHKDTRMGRPSHSLWYAVQRMIFNNGRVGTCRLTHTKIPCNTYPRCGRGIGIKISYAKCG